MTLAPYFIFIEFDVELSMETFLGRNKNILREQKLYERENETILEFQLSITNVEVQL